MKLAFAFLLIGCVLGWVAKGFWHEEEKPKIVDSKPTEVKWKIPKKQIAKVSREEAIGLLNDPIKIEYQWKEDNWLNIKAYNSVQEANKELKIECSSGFGWKIYAAAGVVLTVAVLLVR